MRDAIVRLYVLLASIFIGFVFYALGKPYFKSEDFTNFLLCFIAAMLSMQKDYNNEE